MFKCILYIACGLPLLLVKSVCFKTPKEGAQTSLLCSLIDFEKLKSGEYYEDCVPKKANVKEDWQEQARTLWRLTEEMLDKKGN